MPSPESRGSVEPLPNAAVAGASVVGEMTYWVKTVGKPTELMSAGLVSGPGLGKGGACPVPARRTPCSCSAALTAIETNRCFHFIAFFMEFDRISKFCIEVMFINRRTESNLFDIDDFLIFPCFFIFFLLFKLKLPIVHNTANRWFSIWCN